MNENYSAKLRNKALCAWSELSYGNIHVAKKHLKELIKLMNTELESLYVEGLPVVPPDGEYMVLVEDMHILTKHIQDGHGRNVLPWFTKIPLCRWKTAVEKYGIPMMDFEVIYAPEENCTKFIYKDLDIVDLVRQVRGEQNTWVGALYISGKSQFWFKMVKVND